MNHLIIGYLMHHLFFQVDIVNKSIFDLAFEDDRPSLYNLLQNPSSANELMPTGKGRF